jgi:hypothetical protein
MLTRFATYAFAMTVLLSVGAAVAYLMPLP